jgi:hypothetical protein
MDNRNIEAEDLIAAYESAARAAADASIAAGVAAFRAALDQSRRNRREMTSRDSVLTRYRLGSWKRNILEFVLKLTDSTNLNEFRFSDLSRFEKELRKRHPEQKALMSGVNVTLQGLVKDGVLRQSERGRYQIAF